MVKKSDIILFLFIILISLALLFSFILIPKEKGSTLIIKVNNEEFCRLNLSEEKTIDIGENTVIIKDGEAYMEYAVCPDKVCIHQGKISKVGQTVVCLPQKIILEVE